MFEWPGAQRRVAMARILMVFAGIGQGDRAQHGAHLRSGASDQRVYVHGSRRLAGGGRASGVENTLVILGHKLKRGVTVIREYAADLPRISAYGGALNQIWTNLIVNAIDAMNGQGKLWIRTSAKPDHILVEIGRSEERRVGQ